MTLLHTSTALGIVATLSVGLTGCVLNNPTAGEAISVTSSATECTLSATEAPSGTVQFEVVNSGDVTTEFYILANDGMRVVGEVENI
ncbi:MAG: PbrT family lead (Pb2+) uptake porter, partial [Aurantimicrobium sp.]